VAGIFSDRDRVKTPFRSQYLRVPPERLEPRKRYQGASVEQTEARNDKNKETVGVSDRRARLVSQRFEPSDANSKLKLTAAVPAAAHLALTQGLPEHV
jgi:hypothetical protein